MKAKYILSLALALTGAASLTSCGDFLDTKPAAIYSEDLVWGSASNVEAFVYGRLGTAMGYYLDGYGQNMTECLFTTNLIDARRACPGTARGLMENTYNCGINDRFGFIRACNMIIERCGNSTVLNEFDQKKYVALGKLMRAMCYYDLTRKAGKYIWVDKVLSSDDPDFNLPLTKDITESYQHVLTDLREAVPYLPTNVQAGMLDRNFGYAFLSEVLLQAAAYTNNSASLQVNGKSLYQECVEAVDNISGMSLDPAYSGMFDQNGAYSSPEIIAAYYYDGDRATYQSTGCVTLIANCPNSKLDNTNCGPHWKTQDIFECWLEIAVSQNLVDDYLVIDAADGKAKKWNETSQFLNAAEEMTVAEAEATMAHKSNDIIVKAYKLKNALAEGDSDITDLLTDGRDARYDASILHDKSNFYGEDICMYSYGNMTRWTTTNYFADHLPITNYAIRKAIYTNTTPRPFYNTKTAYHRVLSRYGKAILNKAEAYLCMNNVAEAVAAYNQTRTVHGKLPASTASDLETAWKEYKIERHVDLFLECDYYWSLLRWGKVGGYANGGAAAGSTIAELNVPATFLETKPDRTSIYIGNVTNNNNERVFNTRSYLMPIPQGLINANSAITNADQNPGWE